MSTVSLKDIAATVGVSFQTVSKVLNGKGAVAPDTRRRILEAAENLGYVPNALARSLHGASTYTIGVISTDLSIIESAQQIMGIERQARQHGVAVIISILDPDGSDCERYLRLMMERRVDGVILNTPATEDSPRIGELLTGRLTAVALREVDGGTVPLVEPDVIDTALLPTRHLARMGHRRIATVTGPPQRRITRMRIEGYRRALAEHGIDVDPQLVIDADWTVDGGYHATHRLLDHHPDITAVYAQNDRMAIGALSALHERGMRVPHDCSVVGCDGIAEAARTIPPLTTVRVPFIEAGETATRLLLSMTTQADAGRPASVTLPVSLVYRSSTAPPRDTGAGD